jgi:hypothetical protein
MGLKERVLVVRPYGARVRAKAFALLEKVDLVVDEGSIIPDGTPDAEAVQVAATARRRVLLVPFHAHADRTGRPVDGLGFVRALVAAAPHRDLRVLMPVSRFGAATVALAQDTGTIPACVLVLSEDELDRLETVARVRAHVG